jgi:uncharacterized membrane protein
MKVLYAGDSAIIAMLGLEGAEIYPVVDQVWDAGTHLTEALEGHGIEVVRMASHVAYSDFPETADSLAEYDAVILSDIGHDTLITYPGERRYRVPMGPNRLKEIVSYVAGGGGLVYCGGYFTFQGHYGKGRWADTPVARILPLEILHVPDDRIETPEGAPLSHIDTDHEITAGIDWSQTPVFMGYNRAGDIQNGGRLLGRIGDDEDPFMAVGEHERGRVLVLTSDPAPHWGSDFVRWPHYAQFWGQALRWVTAGAEAAPTITDTATAGGTT